MLKYNMPDLGAKCATYLSKGRLGAMSADPTFTTETQSACNIYRIQKGLPKPPGSLGGRSHRRRRMRGGGPCEAQYAGKAMNLNTIAAIQTCNEQLRASTPCASECAKSPVAKACLDCKVKLRKGGRSRRGRKGRRSGSRRTRRH